MAARTAAVRTKRRGGSIGNDAADAEAEAPAPAPPRLGRDAWIDAALDVLAAAGGADDIRVEPLAKALGITKGSFYWHFRDRGDLLRAVLSSWRDGRLAAIAAQTKATAGAEPAASRLRRLLDLYLDRANPRGMTIELAIRDWARRGDATAAREAVEAVDAERLRIVAGLFAETGCAPDEAAARAHAFYAFIFGRGLLALGDAPVKAGERPARELFAEILIGGGKQSLHEMSSRR